MKRIHNISEIVKSILTNYPDTRNSDVLLYVKVCKTMNPDIADMSFETAMLRREDLGIANFETVRRSRQKIQSENEHLRACEKVMDARYENWKVMREYAME